MGKGKLDEYSNGETVDENPNLTIVGIALWQAVAGSADKYYMLFGIGISK